MTSVSNALYLLFGKHPDVGYMTAVFSVRLDETGVDGKSPFAIVAGGVSLPAGWDQLEQSWERLLERRSVRAFHSKEFNAGSGDFSGWGNIKRKNFIRSIEKIIKTTVSFQVAVAVEREAHAQIKKEMQGIRGFKSDSDVGLCFRIVRFLVCEQIAREMPNAKVQFIVEDGPFAADTHTIYQDIKRTQGARYRPAMYAEMLSGFASVPKKDLLSLEVADYLAGRGIADLRLGRFDQPGRKNQISQIADRDFLRDWHRDMLDEREHRRRHWQR